jgi:putative ATPase
MQCLPENLLGTTFYEPTERGFEQRIRERLEWLRNTKNTDGEIKE